jgi:hypothetical protein
MDHSDRERQRMLDAIDQFAERETRDELGLGSIRDGFAELFFPGTNTIQTRARYFLFVPWMYKALEEGQSGAESPAKRARRNELKLCEALCRGDDTDGVIGARARERLKRLPSNIYWLGLGTWKIRRFSGSQDDYHQRLKRPALFRSVRDDDDEVLEGEGRSAWHAGLPTPPADWSETANLKLSFDEARYLKERIRYSKGDSLLSHLIEVGSEMGGALPWTHPAYAELPPRLREPLDHARLFSETLYGAAILYNLLLWEGSGHGERRDEWVDWLRKGADLWGEELSTRASAIRSWDKTAFWSLASENATVRGSTRDFVEKWWSLSAWESPRAVLDGAAARDLIRAREAQLKGRRARLRNQSALEQWNGAAGLGQLSYRWAVATRMVNDIRAGLSLGGSDARSA